MQCQFVVGQKVVCIDADMGFPEGHVVLEEIRYPEVGKLYTIKAITVGCVTGTPCVELEEIPKQIVTIFANGEPFNGLIYFSAAAFRPVQTRKTDISVFTKMLNQTKVSSHV